MYPFGFLTIANHLHDAGYRVRIANLASMMLNNPRFDVEKFLGRMEAEVFGIDLHWLPHAHGALEVAKIVKKIHPDSSVLMGGFSSTYFHEELIRYPQVDFVLRGDSTEIPVVQLMEALEKNSPLDKVENLTWKEDGKTRVNPLTFVPEDLDYLDIDYGWMVKSVVRYFDFEGFKPWKDWESNPLTVVIPVRGCAYNCVECGGSCSAMRHFLGRNRPAFRSPEKVAEDVTNIQDYFKAPTFIVGDIRMAGDHWGERFLKACRKLGVTNHLAFELFGPASEELFRRMETSLNGYSIEMSPDSHDELIRKKLGRNYTNDALEATIRKALKNGCERFDIFFMVGLPYQDRDSALADSEYCRHLFSITDNDSRLFPYTAPLAPFLDPGSIAFENPEKYGYRLLARTLEEHRIRLTSPSWKDVLSYETFLMNRDQIAEVSYEAAELLNDVRRECGQLDEEEYLARKERNHLARKLLKEVDEVMAIRDPDIRETRLAELRVRGYSLMESTICQKRDLEWNSRNVLRNIPRIFLGILKSEILKRIF